MKELLIVMILIDDKPIISINLNAITQTKDCKDRILQNTIIAFLILSKAEL